MKAFIIPVSNLWVSGIALFPFIFIEKQISKHQKTVLINHERIHIRQQIELLVLPFYFFYLINYLYNFFKYRNHQKAYLAIVFEKEAYHHQTDLSYLNARKTGAWIKYLR